MPVVEIQVSALEKRLAPWGVTGVRRLTGGASSLTFSGTDAGGRRVVVKVAPPGVAPVLHRDVLRQARLIGALHGHGGVAVPEVLWQDAGDPPEVPPLFGMAFVEGTSLEPLFDLDSPSDRGSGAARPGAKPQEGKRPGDDAVVVAERMRNAARVLAAMHAVDPDAIGLGDEPRVGLGEEIDRWCRLLDTVDPALAPGWPDVASTLRRRPVTAMPAAVVHGDFRLGNLLATGTEITAVIDWEIWTVGDPRVDVGWFLVNADPATYRRPTPYAPSMPAPAELTAIYAGALGREVPDLEVFEALACFKSVATWALIVKHNRRRVEPDPDIEAVAATLPHLLARAGELLG